LYLSDGAIGFWHGHVTNLKTNTVWEGGFTSLFENDGNFYIRKLKWNEDNTPSWDYSFYHDLSNATTSTTYLQNLFVNKGCYVKRELVVGGSHASTSAIVIANSNSLDNNKTQSIYANASISDNYKAYNWIIRYNGKAYLNTVHGTGSQVFLSAEYEFNNGSSSRFDQFGIVGVSNSNSAAGGNLQYEAIADCVVISRSSNDTTWDRYYGFVAAYQVTNLTTVEEDPNFKCLKHTKKTPRKTNSIYLLQPINENWEDWVSPATTKFVVALQSNVGLPTEYNIGWDIKDSTSKLGFFNHTAYTQQSANNLDELLTALKRYGLIL